MQAHSHLLSCAALTWLLVTPPNGELSCRLSHLMCCSSWIGFIQSSVQCKDISQGNNNSYQWMWKINIVVIFKEIVFRCVDTRLAKVWAGIQVTTFHSVRICVGKALMSPSTLLIQSKLACESSHLSSLLVASESQEWRLFSQARSKHGVHILFQNRQLCKEYKTLKQAWLKKIERHENNPKRK